jgi:hypothetical protein
MADQSRTGLLLIVTGTTLRAEEADRPLAYYLKQQIEGKLTDLADSRPLKVCVVADIRWLNEESLQALPTISLGGPGVNLLAKNWLEKVPLSMAIDDRFYIQMDPDLEEPHASIWGLDNPDTQIAVSTFVQRYLPRFLEHCLDHAAELTQIDPEVDSETDSGDDETDLDDETLE